MPEQVSGILTFFVVSVRVSLVIVLRKLAKPVTGGEPAGLSPFFVLRRNYYGTAKDIFNLFQTGGMA